MLEFDCLVTSRLRSYIRVIGFVLVQCRFIVNRVWIVISLVLFYEQQFSFIRLTIFVAQKRAKTPCVTIATIFDEI